MKWSDYSEVLYLLSVDAIFFIVVISCLASALIRHRRSTKWLRRELAKNIKPQYKKHYTKARESYGEFNTDCISMYIQAVISVIIITCCSISVSGAVLGIATPLWVVIVLQAAAFLNTMVVFFAWRSMVKKEDVFSELMKKAANKGHK